LLDSTFAVLKVVADTTPGNPNAYGGGLASLIAFRGDSTLFVDAQSLSMLVIDANGEVGRVMSVPRAQDAMMLAAGGMGTGAFYSNGHLVYRGMPAMRMQINNGVPQMPSLPDTMAITRVNLQTRVVDTLGFVKIPKTNTNISRISTHDLENYLTWILTERGTPVSVRSITNQNHFGHEFRADQTLRTDFAQGKRTWFRVWGQCSKGMHNRTILKCCKLRLPLAGFEGKQPGRIFR
jgi:hypothetical protein